MIRRNFLKLCGAVLPVGLLGRVQASPQEIDQKELLTKRFTKIWKEIVPDSNFSCYESIDDPEKLLYFDAYPYRGRIYFEKIFQHWNLEIVICPEQFGVCVHNYLNLEKDIFDEKMWQELPRKIKYTVDHLNRLGQARWKYYQDFHIRHQVVFDELRDGLYEISK